MVFGSDRAFLAAKSYAGLMLDAPARDAVSAASFRASRLLGVRAITDEAWCGYHLLRQETGAHRIVEDQIWLREQIETKLNSCSPLATALTMRVRNNWGACPSEGMQ